MIWAYLAHLSYNMWSDRPWPGQGNEHLNAAPHLRFDLSLWDDMLARMVEAGLNMVVIDLGDGVAYESHPEIAVRRAWSTKRLRKELDRLRRLGLEPIPKLNFSTAHDLWLGPYSRCVSTDAYYGVCRELIAEVIDLFDQPRFFHLGMDEETFQHQRHYDYVVLRQYDLWWRDLYFLIGEVEKGGVRPWVWSDYVWHSPEVFYEKMPRSVLQSNWYYYESFSRDRRKNERAVRVRTYLELDARDYDQVPTGSNYVDPENLHKTTVFCQKHIAPQRLLGFLQTVWKPTLEVCRQRHLEAIAQVGQAKAAL
ncbi:MAG: Tat pathway signal protein [Chloroflexi bacterium]|nr:Tat pathway signal protein [Chloroflexota bacterium]